MKITHTHKCGGNDLGCDDMVDLGVSYGIHLWGIPPQVLLNAYFHSSSLEIRNYCWMLVFASLKDK